MNCWSPNAWRNDIISKSSSRSGFRPCYRKCASSSCAFVSASYRRYGSMFLTSSIIGGTVASCIMCHFVRRRMCCPDSLCSAVIWHDAPSLWRPLRSSRSFPQGGSDHLDLVHASKMRIAATDTGQELSKLLRPFRTSSTSTFIYVDFDEGF